MSSEFPLPTSVLLFRLTSYFKKYNKRTATSTDDYESDAALYTIDNSFGGQYKVPWSTVLFLNGSIYICVCTGTLYGGASEGCLEGASGRRGSLLGHSRFTRKVFHFRVITEEGEKHYTHAHFYRVYYIVGFETGRQMPNSNEKNAKEHTAVGNMRHLRHCEFIDVEFKWSCIVKTYFGRFYWQKEKHDEI